MCLVLFSYHAHKDYPLIIAANRDEFFSRPAEILSLWGDNGSILAGRDIQGGGTWMGVNVKSRRFSALTNFRSPAPPIQEEVTDALSKSSSASPATPPSRGMIVTSYLESKKNNTVFTKELINNGGKFSGYNLLFGTQDRLHYFNNHEKNMTPELIPVGTHGLSNGRLNSSWPKVSNGKIMLAKILGGTGNSNIDLLSTNIFELLGDQTKAPINQLPYTGLNTKTEKQLSSVFIQTPVYGTRVSSIIFFHKSGFINFYERTFDSSGATRITTHIEQQT